jgi:hypothetical protein
MHLEKDKFFLQFKQPQSVETRRGPWPGPFVKHIGLQTGILIVAIEMVQTSGENQGCHRSWADGLPL